MLAVQKGDRPERPSSELPEKIWLLVERCWDQDPDKRPNINDITTEVRLTLSQCPIYDLKKLSVCTEELVSPERKQFNLNIDSMYYLIKKLI